MSETAWDSLISANKKAELKYRNVNPTLKYCLGCPAPKKSRDLFPRKKNPDTLFNVIEEKYDGYKFLSIPDLTFLHHSDHVVSSEFASVNYPFGRVTLFDPNGKVLHNFPKQDRGKDIHFFGITSLLNDDVAICTGDGISIWNLEGDVISKFTNNGVENCCHITLLKNGQLATTCITDVEKKCVTLWDPRNGKVTSQFGSRPEVIETNPLKQKQKILIRNSDIRLPWFISSDSKMNVFISDRNAQSIKVFDSRTHKFLRKFDIAGVDTRCQKGSFMPQGIAMDEDDNVFVVDQVSDSVLLFDKHGEIVRKFHLPMDNSGIELWSLALSNRPQLSYSKRNRLLSPSRKMAVSFSNRKPRAQVYDLSFCRHYSIGF